MNVVIKSSANKLMLQSDGQIVGEVSSSAKWVRHNDILEDSSFEIQMFSKKTKHAESGDTVLFGKGQYQGELVKIEDALPNKEEHWDDLFYLKNCRKNLVYTPFPVPDCDSNQVKQRREIEMAEFPIVMIKCPTCGDLH